MGDNPFFSRINTPSTPSTVSPPQNVTVTVTATHATERDSVNGTWVRPGDKKIDCRDCGETFLFRVYDQEHFTRQGYPDPKTCKACKKDNVRNGKFPYRAGFMPPPPAGSPIVFLKGLHHSCTLAEIASIFEAKKIFGTWKNGFDILFCKLHKDDRKNSFAFIKFASPELAKEALKLTVRCPVTDSPGATISKLDGEFHMPRVAGGNATWNSSHWMDVPHQTFLP